MTTATLNNNNTITTNTVDAKSTDNDIVYPEDFICPLTMNVMVDPMASKYGHNFERKAILEWLDADSNVDSLCPMTRQPLFPSMLISNAHLKRRIHAWCFANGDKERFINSEGEQDFVIIKPDERTKRIKDVGGECYNEQSSYGGMDDVFVDYSTDSESETEDSEEISADVAAIVEIMRSMAQHHGERQAAERSNEEENRNEGSRPSCNENQTNDKKSRKVCSLFSRISRKSKR